MNPAENTSEQNLDPVPNTEPIIGYCRETGKPLKSSNAETVNGVLYSREAAARLRQNSEASSPYSAPEGGSGKGDPEASPGWAFVLGLIPGVGAIYNQQYAKGMFHIIVFAVLISLAERSGGPLAAFLIAGWAFYMPFEAYHTAQRRQRGQAVDEFSGLVQMPENLKRLPVGPLLLIGLGVAILLDNLGLLRIDELLRFWPVLLIAAGAVLLVQRLQGAEAPKEGNGHVQ